MLMYNVFRLHVNISVKEVDMNKSHVDIEMFMSSMSIHI